MNERWKRGACCVLALWAFLQPCPAAAQGKAGLPASERQGLVVVRTGYTVDYNVQTKNPNWVAWVLTAQRGRGEAQRSSSFRPDPAVGARCARTGDYTRSGYDRGHLCPAADNKWDARAMKESFYMSNISPQLPGLNRGSWKKLEDRCRRWAAAGGTYYIVAGPVFSEAPAKHIGAGRVAVPGGFFKVIYTDVGGRPRAAGFLFDNVEGKSTRERIVTVDAVERLTHYDFFPDLPDATEKKVEGTVDAAAWR